LRHKNDATGGLGQQAGFAIFAKRTQFHAVCLKIQGVAWESRAPYIPRWKDLGVPMRAETERTIEEIKQALSLLRRHL
jgi:hypothetical protein